MEIPVNQTSIDTCLWSIQRNLIHKHGTFMAEVTIAPLMWYVNTGRASIDFLRKLMAAKPFMVARCLHRAGSYDDAIKRVKSCIGFTDA